VVIDGVKLAYPVSSSPAPLNVMHLSLAKLVVGPAGGLLAVFTNGEIHALDVSNTQAPFTFLTKIISDEQLFDASLSPVSVASSHAFDTAKNGLWSVVSSGMFAYQVFTSFANPSAPVPGSWLLLNANMMLDPIGDYATETDFSPESFVNGLMVNLDDGGDDVFMVEMESLPNVGFDQLVSFNTTSGVSFGPVYNLMNYQVHTQTHTHTHTYTPKKTHVRTAT